MYCIVLCTLTRGVMACNASYDGEYKETYMYCIVLCTLTRGVMPPMMVSIRRLSSVMDSIYCACAVFCTPCIKTWYRCRCMLALHLSP